MAKYNKGNYFQVNKDIFRKVNESSTLKLSDKFLFITLLKLENELTNSNRNYFFRSIANLCQDTGLSNKTIISGLNRLAKDKFIKKWRAPLKRKGNHKNTRETITFIRIL